MEPLPTLTSLCTKPVTSMLKVTVIGMGDTLVGEVKDDEIVATGEKLVCISSSSTQA